MRCAGCGRSYYTEEVRVEGLQVQSTCPWCKSPNEETVGKNVIRQKLRWAIHDVERKLVDYQRARESVLWKRREWQKRRKYAESLKQALQELSEEMKARHEEKAKSEQEGTGVLDTHS